MMRCYRLKIRSYISKTSLDSKEKLYKYSTTLQYKVLSGMSAIALNIN